MAAALIACGLLGACASQIKQHEEDLGRLTMWLPGRYGSEAGNGLGQRSLTILPVYAPRIGDHVFYVHEMAAGDPARVTAQLLIAFEVVKGRGIVQSVWSLTEPDRWRDAHLDPDLFKGLMPQDFSLVPGCEVEWRREGERFLGRNDPGRCRVPSRSGAGSVQLDYRVELGPDEYVVTDSTLGNPGGSVLRFRKRGI